MAVTHDVRRTADKVSFQRRWDMATHTNQTTGCAKMVVHAIDVLDVDRDLRGNPIPLSDTLARCGCGPQKCSILAKWVNKKRALVGKPPLPSGTIKPSTTIAEVIDHVCA
jgi:hypothetical protein